MNRINDVKGSAKGRWREIHYALAPELDFITSRGNKHGPCICGGKDRARCHDDYEETGGIICSQCEMGADGIAVLMKANGWDFKTTLSHLKKYLGLDQSLSETKNHSVYEKASPDNLTVQAYLKSRNPTLEAIEPIKETKLDYWNSNGSKPVNLGTYPVMIVPFVRDRKTVGYHKTFLKNDGSGKADVSNPKKTQKVPGVDKLTGGYIPLGCLSPIGKLGVAEGIETALAASRATGMIVWGCGNSHLLDKIKIPQEVLKSLNELHIFADLDRSSAGLKAAESLAQRYACQKRSVFIHLPEEQFNEGQKSIDWLDTLNAKGPDFIRDSIKKAKPFKRKVNSQKINIPEINSGSLDLTDVGNSLRFVKHHGQKVKFVPVWGKFLIWNGKNWAKDDSGKIYEFAIETARSIYAEATNHPDYEEQKEIVKHARYSQGKARLDAMISLVKHQVAISPAQLDENPFLFNCSTGTIDLKTGELIPHDPSHLLTKISSVEFNPNAKCPTWERFLSEVFNGDNEMVEFLQRAIGYGLTGDTSEQCLFFLHGTGRNGKSTLLETLMVLFGDYSTKAEMRAFMEKKGDSASNDIASLAGSRMVCAVESGRGQFMNESLVKELSGGDSITARFLYQEFFSFKPQFKLFLATNSKPQIRGSDEGIWRRIRLLPFEIVVSKDQVDRKLPGKLLNELPGILFWAVQGCLDWQKNGLHEPKIVVEATSGYRQEMDLLADFFNSEVVTERYLDLKKGQIKVSAAQIYQKYTQFCEVSGADPVKKRSFGLMMGERGYTAKPQLYNGKKQRVYTGIGLLDDLQKRGVLPNTGTYGTQGTYGSGNFPLENHAYKKSLESCVPCVPSVPKENKKSEKPDGIWEVTI
jgi:P4 family phage/plasmid primase-like protien